MYPCVSNHLSSHEEAPGDWFGEWVVIDSACSPMLFPQESERPIPVETRAHLARVLASPLFQRSPRQSSFLRFVVEKMLAGEREEIKEYEIAVNVYGRRADHSTRIDPIVRVEAARLRSRLLRYYATDGQHESVRIELPKGAYAPKFVAVRLTDIDLDRDAAGLQPQNDEPRARETGRTKRTLRWIGAIGAISAAALLIWTFASRPTGSPLMAPHTK